MTKFFARVAVSAVLGFAAIVGATLAAPSAGAYPGADGYDSGYCIAGGIKMGYSNWFSGTGQIVAIDVDDNSSSNALRRVQWSSSLWVGTAVTDLARHEIYRASRTEVPTLTLFTTSGAYCSVKLDG